ncbi:MAG: hypothetical protein B6240_10295 [Desulfobacteraceae bacterium 4572_87]|nr:MAG: hypothetical protein B6240_10295 [Desulfobacteraceae bacterium 4572_87]
MKIGVLSDTHLNQITQEFVDIYNTHLSDVDMIIHAGDIVSLNIIDFLEKNVFHGVQGNMDPLEIKARLPEKKIVEVGCHRLGIIHGWGAARGLEDRIFPLFPNGRCPGLICSALSGLDQKGINSVAKQIVGEVRTKPQFSGYFSSLSMNFGFRINFRD